jgi:hypothetical protein
VAVGKWASKWSKNEQNWSIIDRVMDDFAQKWQWLWHSGSGGVAVAGWQWRSGSGEMGFKMIQKWAELEHYWLRYGWFFTKVAVAVAVAGWQWMGGSGWVAVGKMLENDPKMSRIGALLAEIWTSFA